MKIVFLALILVLSATNTFAQSNCANREEISKNLEKQNFFLNSRGLMTEGNVLEIYTNDNDSFVVVKLIPRKNSIIACILTTGEYWSDYNPTHERKNKITFHVHPVDKSEPSKNKGRGKIIDIFS